MHKLFSGLVTSTFFKYLIAGVASYIAAKLGLDQGTAEGFVSGGIAMLMAAWGMLEASKDKVVVDGQRVLAKDLPDATKRQIEAVAAAKKVERKTLLDLFR